MAKPVSHLPLGALLRARRRELGISVRALSEQTGVAPSTISRIENGHFLPTLETAMRLSKVIGLDLSVSLAGPLTTPAEITIPQDEHPPASLKEATTPVLIR